MPGGEQSWRPAAACAQAEGLLSERLEGGLHGLGRFRLAAHLARCERCRALWRSLRWLVEQLRLLGERDFRPAPSASVAERVVARIRCEQLSRPSPGGKDG